MPISICDSEERGVDKSKRGPRDKTAIAGALPLSSRLHVHQNRIALRWTLLCSLSIVLLSATAHSDPPPLNSLRAIKDSPQVRAGQAVPVAFEATVTCCRDFTSDAYLQDGSFGIFLESGKAFSLHPGERVFVRGSTRPSFRPVIVASDVVVLREGSLPHPVPATFSQLINGSFDARMVRVHGRVRTSLSSDFLGGHALELELAVAGGNIHAIVDAQSPAEFGSMTDCEVEASGVEIARFDGKMEQIGVALMIPSASDIRIEQKTCSKNLSLPIIPFSDVVNYWKVTDRSQRVRVDGTVTYNSMVNAIVIQNGNHSIWIGTIKNSQAKVGDFVDVTGFPTLEFGTPALELGEIVRSSSSDRVVPQVVDALQMQRADHAFDLVSIEGKLLSEVQEQAGVRLTLSANGQLISANLRQPSSNQGKTLLPAIRDESKVRVTGICMPVLGSIDGPCSIRMRSAEDVVLLAGPPLLNAKTLPRLLVALLFLVVAASVWAWTLRRQVRRQTRALAIRIEAEADSQRRLAELEHRRRRIMEKINSNVPLDEILREIAETTSLHLDNVPCWLETPDGNTYGTPSWDLESSRGIEVPILGRSGSILGNVCSANSPESLPNAGIHEVLAEAARMAALAIETRQHYADLRRRSDVDHLTDLFNRSYLKRHVDSLIESCRHTSAQFGLIYIDLNEFKAVNDLYGHHVGDLYLQQVAARMKRQLRAVDVLARVGGDEFVAVSSTVRDRAELIEIARRLERCFDEDFGFDNISFKGKASLGVALYPEDASTFESLLERADTAMYGAKRKGKQSTTEEVSA